MAEDEQAKGAVCDRSYLAVFVGHGTAVAGRQQSTYRFFKKFLVSEKLCFLVGLWFEKHEKMKNEKICLNLFIFAVDAFVEWGGAVPGGVDGLLLGLGSLHLHILPFRHAILLTTHGKRTI